MYFLINIPFKQIDGIQSIKKNEKHNCYSGLKMCFEKIPSYSWMCEINKHVFFFTKWRNDWIKVLDLTLNHDVYLFFWHKTTRHKETRKNKKSNKRKVMHNTHFTWIFDIIILMYLFYFFLINYIFHIY
jgi:hypothetical protein